MSEGNFAAPRLSCRGAVAWSYRGIRARACGGTPGSPPSTPNRATCRSPARSARRRPPPVQPAVAPRFRTAGGRTRRAAGRPRGRGAPRGSGTPGERHGGGVPPRRGGARTRSRPSGAPRRRIPRPDRGGRPEVPKLAGALPPVEESLGALSLPRSTSKISKAVSSSYVLSREPWAARSAAFAFAMARSLSFENVFGRSGCLWVPPLLTTYVRSVSSPT